MTTTPTTTADESPMFAPIPSWERGKKRRSFGRPARPAAVEESRSFAPVAATTPRETAPVVDRLSTVDASNADFAAAPIYANRSQPKSSGAPVAIVAGLILIGGIATAGWYFTQPHGQAGVAELTPGATTTTTTATTAAPVDATPPSQMAQTAPPPVAKAATTTTTRTASASRTRAPIARSRAASDNSANVSATAPMPMPTPSVAPPAAAAAPAPPLVLNIPPAAAAPQPAPQPAAPAPTEVPQA